MNEERLEILRMLKAGKISVEEAEMLLEAIESPADRRGQRKCCGAFGDFDFNFESMFGDLFGGFDDIFGSSTGQRNRRRARESM